MKTIMNSGHRALIGCALAAAVLVPRPAAAQLDPLLFARKTQPNVLIAIDTSNRMQRDPDNNYRDNNVYSRTGALYELPLGVSGSNTNAKYRRKYVNLLNTDNGLGTGDKFSADTISIVGDLQSSYSTFDALTRINLAKVSVIEAINRNTAVARFGLLRMRQTNPHFTTAGNIEPVSIADVNEQTPTDGSSGVNGKWKITTAVVDARNGATTTSGLLYSAGSNNQNIVTLLGKSTGAVGSLIPAGNDAANYRDAPIDTMLDDLSTTAKTLIDSDTDCRNTVAVLIVGGGRGDSSSGDPAAKASAFLNVSKGHRVPIYVILLSTPATTAADRAQLQAVAANSGGQFFEVTGSDVGVVSAGIAVPKIVQAINIAVSHAFADQGTFDKAPDATHPYGYSTEHQVTSPIVGTVNLENAKDIAGVPLPNTVIKTSTGEVIPQRSNLLITSGFALPGFGAALRAFRVYKPVADASRPSGYAFTSDGTRLWVAGVPDESSRNIYTATPDGKIIKFSAANAAVLQPYLRSSSLAAAQSLITFIRSQPLGAIVDSTPAIQDAPSLDPPPDSDYPGFADAHKNRRTMIWVGANDGMLHAIDARLGKEVWAFIPFNLLPKLDTLRSGQPMGDFRYFVDGSPKVADVKVNGQWRTYLVMGEGPGGTFYQTFDVTMDNMTVDPASDTLSDVLGYFANDTSVGLQWTFPRYSTFDWTCSASNSNCPNSPWGDLASTASAVEKSVGQTWSDPAIGQVETATGRFTVLVGSGFFKYSRQQDPNRGGIVAGSTFYLLDANDGSVLDYRNVGNDGKGETVDDCTTAVKGCTQLKNALQADPVATGPADSRFITKAYLGDLDGNIWRFDIGLDASKVPKIKQLVALYSIKPNSGLASDHPVFASMATVNVGGAQQYLFVGTGSDLLPSTGVSNAYALLVVLDGGTSGSKVAEIDLEKVDGTAGEEKVSAFPAVAGDIVFFSTTTYHIGGCSLPDGNLYAFTFIGGPAYDTNGDGRVTSGRSGSDSTKVRTSTGARASAPFIVDQHLVLATGNKIEMFGDPSDFNNGVGEAGVRILSWREVR
jgi:hypothetical protein